MQIQESVEDIVDIAVVLVSRTVLRVEEELLHLALGVEMLREEIDISVVGKEEIVLHILGIVAEGVAEEVSTDIWLGEAILVELHAHVPEVLERIRHSRREVTAEAPNIRFAHLPDTEEAEDMVYTICVEVVRHLGEAELPPLVVVLSHDIPVVGREAPVLTTCVEVIGWRTCRSREVEEVWVGGSVHRVRRDTDRNIALECHAYRVCVVHCLAELFVRMELEVAVEVLRLFVALREELCVRQEPALVGSEESLIFVRSEESSFVGLVEGLEVLHLLVVNALVVRDGLGVELLLCLAILLELSRSEGAHLLDIEVDWVEREDANRVVRI
jgi:hypothetical protein